MTLPLASTPATGDNSNALATTAFVKAQGYLTSLAGGEVVRDTTAVLTGTGTYGDSGLAIDLPAAGTYLVVANIRPQLQVSGGYAWISVELYDSAAGSVVANSERLAIFVDSGDTFLHQEDRGYTWIVAVAAATTLRVYAKRDGTATTWTYSQFLGSADGRTTLGYVRFA
jgi:hypothetical protein